MTFYTFSDQAKAFERSVQRGLAYEAEDKLQDMQRVVEDGVRWVRFAYDVLSHRAWMEDMLAKIINEATETQAACHRDMSVLLWRLPVLDLSEAYNLLQEIER